MKLQRFQTIIDAGSFLVFIKWQIIHIWMQKKGIDALRHSVHRNIVHSYNKMHTWGKLDQIFSSPMGVFVWSLLECIQQSFMISQDVHFQKLVKRSYCQIPDLHRWPFLENKEIDFNWFLIFYHKTVCMPLEEPSTAKTNPFLVQYETKLIYFHEKLQGQDQTNLCCNLIFAISYVGKIKNKLLNIAWLRRAGMKWGIHL